MSIAWSHHLSQVTGQKIEGSGQTKTKSQTLSRPAVNGEFVLGALCKLLEAASYDQITPIILKLRGFVQWFDHSELFLYRCVISTLIEEAEMLHRFHNSTSSIVRGIFKAQLRTC